MNKRALLSILEIPERKGEKDYKRSSEEESGYE